MSIIARFLHITDTHLWPPGTPVPTAYFVALKGHDSGPWGAIWSLLQSEQPDAILWSGDVATAQKSGAYDVANQQLCKWNSIPGPVLTHATGVPVFCVPGNHDHYSVVSRTAIYLRERSLYARSFNDPKPSVHHRQIKGKDFFIFRIDTSSGINVADSLRLATGRIHRSDLGIIESWIKVAREGGQLDGKNVTAEQLRASWNILLMHHDLSSKVLFHAIDGNGAVLLLKFIAATPIHIITCGHIHTPDEKEYKLFAAGRLDKRQRRRLTKMNALRAESVRVSRPGTTSQVGAQSHHVHIIEFDNIISVRRLTYDGRYFS